LRQASGSDLGIHITSRRDCAAANRYCTKGLDQSSIAALQLTQIKDMPHMLRIACGMDAALLERYGGMVPRYTSYPTAPHFHAGVTGADYRVWLGGLTAKDHVSLYLHVPFCQSMCWYCGCHTKVVQKYQPIADYVALIKRELGLVSAAIGARPTISHVHFGGGTPNVLSPAHFRALMESIDAHFGWCEQAEIAVEIDPRSLTIPMVEAFAETGVTRGSLGVQDFAPDVQAAINRLQPFEMTARAVDWLREAGIAALNFDLMYGLPRQTVDGVLETVDRAVDLKPDRLALFGYAHVPWMKSHQRLIDPAALPDRAARFAQAGEASRRLVAHGYHAIGLDHFARPHDAMAQALAGQRLHRNFQGYTSDQASTLIGFGASAIGALTDGYVQNAVPFKAYGLAIEAGVLAVERGFRLSDDDRARRAAIEALMCNLSVDLSAIERDFGQPPGCLSEATVQLAPMISDGLVEVSGTKVRITERGRPFMRSVCTVLDHYLGRGAARHSQAV